MTRHFLMPSMRHWLSLFAVVTITPAATASADDFAHVDPVRLAKSIEKLAEAWSLDVVVADGATDDFADDELFQAREPEEIVDLPEKTNDRDAKLERALLDLGTGKQDDSVVGRIGRQ